MVMFQPLIFQVCSCPFVENHREFLTLSFPRNPDGSSNQSIDLWTPESSHPAEVNETQRVDPQKNPHGEIGALFKKGEMFGKPKPGNIEIICIWI